MIKNIKISHIKTPYNLIHYIFTIKLKKKQVKIDFIIENNVFIIYNIFKLCQKIKIEF